MVLRGREENPSVSLKKGGKSGVRSQNEDSRETGKQMRSIRRWEKKEQEALTSGLGKKKGGGCGLLERKAKPKKKGKIGWN